jgi:hypothetical protein
MKTKEYCPIIDKHLKNKCGVTTCMYFNSADGNCIESKMRALPEDRQGRFEIIKTVYSVDISDLQDGIHRIAECENLRRYFKYIANKNIDEMTVRDIERVKGSKETYNSWNGYKGKKPTFGRICYWLDFVATQI